MLVLASAAHISQPTAIQPEPQVRWEEVVSLAQMLHDQVLKALRLESGVESCLRERSGNRQEI